ncbi:serine palmitoyltransferase 1 [Bicyclus anynana]|uniref:Serine palmitoyltransferase 1 n=1 Tax=Bicyclus anynana TaxID=110368 RepID=A0ABM3LRD7_BICAN|nr:serine palmitoyltransferase 1 [Bicyclus anynana]
MILLDIVDTASWWTIVIAVQVVIGCAYFLCTRKSKKHEDKLTKKMLLEWKPKPLVEEEIFVPQPQLMGKIDEGMLNVGCTSFLGFDKEPQIMERAIKSLHKYGVGSCGPRGFYGTIDVHLELEERLAKFLQVEETCVYSYGFSTIASAIPAYAKKGDIIFADEKVWFAIQKGIDASRSTVVYFKHNNMKDLERKLEMAAFQKDLNPQRRAFLIAEAIYYNTGTMCPLRKLVELARRYKLRIILDESLSIGTLGEHGRGLTEFLGVPRDEIDLIVGSLEHSFASIGGFCAGSHFIVEHQRLSGLGYCFSASLPPMLTEAAIAGLDILEAKPHLIAELNLVANKLQCAFSGLNYFTVSGDDLSPIKHLYPRDVVMPYETKMEFLHNIEKYCLHRGIAVAVTSYIKDAEKNCPEPSLRIAASTKLNDAHIDELCDILERAYLHCRS